MRWLLVLLVASCSRWTVLPADSTPACALDGTIANTAPGFTLPAGHTRVFVVSRTDIDPAQQKLDAEVIRVVQEQGGVVVDEPSKADLVISAATDDFTIDREAVEYATATARTFGSFSYSLVGRPGGGWGLSESSTIARVPLVVTKHTRVTKLSLDVFQPRAGDASKLREVWRAELQAGSDAFRATPHECVEVLFRRIAGPDGVF